MRRLFFSAATLMILLTNACSIGHKTLFAPTDPVIDADPQKLYASKQYDQALMAMLETDPKQLEDPARKHIDTALKLYPDHQASLLFKKKIDAVHLKVDPKNPKLSHKKITATGPRTQ